MTAELHKRRIVCVLDYFDEENELPWDYVMRSGDGRFEAVVTYLYDDLRDEKHSVARERSLGVFDDCNAAARAIWAHRARLEAADHQTWRTPDGRFDFNKPTEH